MTLELSRAEAARVLRHYHFQPRTIAEVFRDLGTVQYDPLNPVGRNPDLVLQARVPEYRFDEWQWFAYEERRAYDAWDKQACLVPIADWPLRAHARVHYQPWHDREILREHPDVVRSALDEIERRGPLSSLEFEDRSRAVERHSWYGPTRIKRVLRALWAQGTLVTHHREGGRHYYHLAERVIPQEHYLAPPVADEGAYHRWIVRRRHESAGLLRFTADAAIWSGCGDSATRRSAVEELVDSGDLIPLRIEGSTALYHMPARLQSILTAPPELLVRFLAPLDNILWDRRAVRQIFDFDYVWEVYKPEKARIWGYYVLPVLFGDRFVARFEARTDAEGWEIVRWWWEEGVEPDAEMIEALRDALRRFTYYLGAGRLKIRPRHPWLRSARP